MIGKIFYDNKWHFCKYEGNNLLIIKDKTSCPFIFSEYNITFSKEHALANFENGETCFFDLSENVKELKDEYYLYEYDNPNYFSCDQYNLNQGFEIHGIKRITFKNGVLRQLLTLSEIPSFVVMHEGMCVKMEFLIKDAVEYPLSTSPHFTMLSNYPTMQKEFCIVAEMEHTVDITVLNKLIDKLYMVVQFLSTDYNAPIGEIEAESDIGILKYFKSNIPIDDKKFNRFNYANNCKEILPTLVQNIFNVKYDFGFLSLIDKDRYVNEDYWILAHSIDNNIDLKNASIQNIDFWEEEKAENKLNEYIKKAISNFEEENIPLDKDKKDFLFGLLRMSPFRKKVMAVLEITNEISHKYHRFPSHPDSELKNYATQFCQARNSIHGDKKFDTKKVETSVIMLIVGLYLQILYDCGASIPNALNMLTGMFS